jgi:membrane-associated phospholipid phosphatase
VPPSLIELRWRAPARTAALVSAAIVIILSVLLFHATTDPVDTWVFRELLAHVGADGSAELEGVTSPTISIALLAMVVVVAGLVRRWDVVLLAVAGPVLALGLTELVLKPVVGRTLSPVGSPAPSVQGCFPSGHETGASAAAVVLLIVAGQVRMGRPGRLVEGVVLVGWLLLVAAGLVRNQFHYAADTLGAVAVSVAVVLSTALVIDRIGLRTGRPIS